MTLKIDTQMVADQAHRLSFTKDAIEQDTNLLDFYDDYLGSGKLADRMHDVMKNWTTKRQEILDHLTSMAQATQGVADAWNEEDQKFAEAFGGGKK
jgi:uncharacterized protein YukE